MKHIYAFENREDYDKYEPIIQRFSERLAAFEQTMEKGFALNDKPKGVLWTSAELATSVLSEIPVPAYTNRDLIYISPDLEAWRTLFLTQLDGKDLPHIRKFYENYSENHLFTILAHELTHHSDLFPDEFDGEREDSIWFEEGMCEYLPKKLLLSQAEFDDIVAVETELVEVFKAQYGSRSMDEFGSSSYFGSLSSIMFDYWRSFLAVKFLVEERFGNDIQAVFADYHKWHEEGCKMPLAEYFRLDQ
ncbi:hypothetical protein [Planococcus beigongshangi]|uniref:hypothetical protein n=1 Tax=Planococcus beigongshangi TaxID=2782536 RepID=UPI00193BA5B0|nr:hypothetical protein [Planococcus beigongshangi]